VGKVESLGALWRRHGGFQIRFHKSQPRWRKVYAYSSKGEDVLSLT